KIQGQHGDLLPEPAPPRSDRLYDGTRNEHAHASVRQPGGSTSAQLRNRPESDRPLRRRPALGAADLPAPCADATGLPTLLPIYVRPGARRILERSRLPAGTAATPS